MELLSIHMKFSTSDAGMCRNINNIKKFIQACTTASQVDCVSSIKAMCYMFEYFFEGIPAMEVENVTWMALIRQQEVSPCGKCNVHSIVHSYIMRLGNDMHVFKASISIKRLQYNGNVCLLPDQWIVISVHFLTIKKQWFLALLKSREKPMGKKAHTQSILHLGEKNARNHNALYWTSGHSSYDQKEKCCVKF